MTQSNRNLWPHDLGATLPTPPVAILREQANFLASKTRGLLEGEVVSRHERGRNAKPFLHEFRIRAPAFGDYRYLLLDLRHDFDSYPAVIRFRPSGSEFTVNSQEELVARLRELFAAKETRRVIDSLLSQIGGTDESD